MESVKYNNLDIFFLFFRLNIAYGFFFYWDRCAFFGNDRLPIIYHMKCLYIGLLKAKKANKISRGECSTWENVVFILNCSTAPYFVFYKVLMGLPSLLFRSTINILYFRKTWIWFVCLQSIYTINKSAQLRMDSKNEIFWQHCWPDFVLVLKWPPLSSGRYLPARATPWLEESFRMQLQMQLKDKYVSVPHLKFTLKALNPK